MGHAIVTCDLFMFRLCGSWEAHFSQVVVPALLLTGTQIEKYGSCCKPVAEPFFQYLAGWLILFVSCLPGFSTLEGILEPFWRGFRKCWDPSCPTRYELFIGKLRSGLATKPPVLVGALHLRTVASVTWRSNAIKTWVTRPPNFWCSKLPRQGVRWNWAMRSRSFSLRNKLWTWPSLISLCVLLGKFADIDQRWPKTAPIKTVEKKSARHTKHIKTHQNTKLQQQQFFGPLEVAGEWGPSKPCEGGGRTGGSLASRERSRCGTASSLGSRGS